MKAVFISVIAILMVVIVILSVSSCTKDEPNDVVLNEIEQRQIFANGTVEGRSDGVELRFELVGRVNKVYVSEGEKVEEGDLLLSIDASTLEKEVTQAKAAIELAEKQESDLAVPENLNRLLRDQFRRFRTYTAKNLRDDVDDILIAEVKDELEDFYGQDIEEVLDNIAENDEDQEEDSVSEAKISLAKTGLEIAESILEKAKIYSPIDGTVLRIESEAGEIAGPDYVSMIVSDTSETYVRAFIEELDVSYINVGMDAVITSDGIDNVFTGKVRSFQPSMVPKSNVRNRPGEREDVKVREALIYLDKDQSSISKLIVGLPVDVRFD